MSTLAIIVLSAFAALGMFFFVNIFLEIVFSRDIGTIITVVPVASRDIPVEEILRTVNSLYSSKATVVVDIYGNLTKRKNLVERGLCSAVTQPKELGDVLQGMID